MLSCTSDGSRAAARKIAPSVIPSAELRPFDDMGKPPINGGMITHHGRRVFREGG
jgi:hypothetical protein